MDINPKIFREYDIRGIVGQDMDETVVETLGRAMGTFFLGRGQKDVAKESRQIMEARLESLAKMYEKRKNQRPQADDESEEE